MSGAEQALVSDTGDASGLVQGLRDAIPLGPHPAPHAEWTSVRLDMVQGAIDHIEWLEKGVEEWRDMANTARAAHQRLQRRMDAITKIVATLADVTGQ